MAAADHQDVERAHAAPYRARRGQSAVFHVKQLLADAEAPEQRIEHVLGRAAADSRSNASRPGASPRPAAAGRLARASRSAAAPLEQAALAAIERVSPGAAWRRALRRSAPA
jgi:hypothetical protein